MFIGSGHRVTGVFRWSQIVTPVVAECIARMGVTTPCGASSGLSQTPLLESTQPVSPQPVSSQLAPSQPKKGDTM